MGVNQKTMKQGYDIWQKLLGHLNPDEQQLKAVTVHLRVHAGEDTDASDLIGDNGAGTQAHSEFSPSALLTALMLLRDTLSSLLYTDQEAYLHFLDFTYWVDDNTDEIFEENADSFNAFQTFRQDLFNDLCAIDTAASREAYNTATLILSEIANYLTRFAQLQTSINELATEIETETALVNQRLAETLLDAINEQETQLNKILYPDNGGESALLPFIFKQNESKLELVTPFVQIQEQRDALDLDKTRQHWKHVKQHLNLHQLLQATQPDNEAIKAALAKLDEQTFNEHPVLSKSALSDHAARLANAPSRKDTVQVFSLDADGCVLGGQALINAIHNASEPITDVTPYHTELIRTLNTAAGEAKTRIVMVGSNRQDAYVDQTNGQKNIELDFNDPDQGVIQTGSCFASIRSFTTPLKARFHPMLMADIFNDLPLGASMAEAEKALQNNAYPSEKLRKDAHPQTAFDSKKVTLLYAQIHEMASQHPGKPIDFHFVDDRDDILEQGLANFFGQHPDFLPKNVTLHLHLYAPKRQGDPLNTSEYLKFDPIIGTGKIDKNYAITTRAFMGLFKSRAKLSHPDLLYQDLDEAVNAEKFRLQAQHDALKIDCNRFVHAFLQRNATEAQKLQRAKCIHDAWASLQENGHKIGLKKKHLRKIQVQLAQHTVVANPTANSLHYDVTKRELVALETQASSLRRLAKKEKKGKGFSQDETYLLYRYCPELKKARTMNPCVYALLQAYPVFCEKNTLLKQPANEVENLLSSFIEELPDNAKTEGDILCLITDLPRQSYSKDIKFFLENHVKCVLAPPASKPTINYINEKIAAVEADISPLKAEINAADNFNRLKAKTVKALQDYQHSRGQVVTANGGEKLVGGSLLTRLGFRNRDLTTVKAKLIQEAIEGINTLEAGRSLSETALASTKLSMLLDTLASENAEAERQAGKRYNRARFCFNHQPSGLARVAEDAKKAVDKAFSPRHG